MWIAANQITEGMKVTNSWHKGMRVLKVFAPGRDPDRVRVKWADQGGNVTTGVFLAWDIVKKEN